MGSLSSKPSHTDRELQWLAFHGTVVSIHETSGVVSFVLGKKEARARFERANTCLDGIVVPQRSPLEDTIRVGMRAFVHFVQNECDADDSAVRHRAHVDVIVTATRCQDCSLQKFRGVIKTECRRTSAHPGVAVIFLNGVEEKVTFRACQSDFSCENWSVGRKVDVCGVFPSTTSLGKEEARYEACGAITPSQEVKGFQITSIASFDPSTRSGSFYYDNYNGKLVVGFVVHDVCSYREHWHLTTPELLSHIYAGREIEIANFPLMMYQHDVYRVNVNVNVGGLPVFDAGPKLKDRPDLPSLEDRLSLGRIPLDRLSLDRLSLDRTTVTRATEDRVAVDRATVDRATVDKVTVDRATVDKATVDRATVDRTTVDGAHQDRTAINSAALRKNTFPDVKQFPSNKLPACPPAAASPDEFNLDSRREVTSVERSRRSATAQTADPGNERPSTSARNAEGSLAGDLVGIGDSDHVRLNYKTLKVDFRSECASASGQLTGSRCADVCIRDDLGEAEDSGCVGRDETTENADVAIAQTATPEWHSEAAFAEKYICGGRREARRTECSVRETARTGFAGEPQSVWPNVPTWFGLSLATALLDNQVEAKETGGSENDVASSGPNKRERKMDWRYFEAESRGQDQSKNASGNSRLGRGPTTEECVPGNTTGKDGEAVRAESGGTKTGGESKKMDLNYAEKEVTKPTGMAVKFSRGTETGNPVPSAARPWRVTSHEEANTKTVPNADVGTVPFTDIWTVPSAQDTQTIEPTYSGVISSVSKCSCVVAFILNGREEAARCCRAFATLDGRPVAQDVSLKVTLEVGARAVLSHVEEHFGEAYSVFRIRYRAVVDVKGAPKEKVTIVPAATEKPDLCLSDLVVPGVVITVDDRFAVASCRLDGPDEKVLFTPQYVFVVGTSAQQGTPLYDVVPQGTPLCDVITVGAKVILSAFKHYSTGLDKTIPYTARASVHRKDLRVAPISAKASVQPPSFNTTAGLKSSLLSTNADHKPSSLNTTKELKSSSLNTTKELESSSIKTTAELKPSWLNATTELKKYPLHAAAELKPPPPPSTVTEHKPQSFVTPLDDLYSRTFLADVFSLKPKSGVATFKLYGKVQKARFTRANVNIDGVVVPQNVPLSETLSVGTEIVLRKVEEHDEHDLTVLYKGNVSVITRSSQLNSKDSLATKTEVKINSTGAVPKQNVAKLQAIELKPSPLQVLEETKTPMFDASDELYDSSFPAVVYSLQERSGVAKFKLEGDWQKARFTRANVFINYYQFGVPQNVPLSEALSVGEEVLLVCVEEHDEHDPTVLYKGSVCSFRKVDNLQTKVAQKTSAQSTATPAVNETQPNITKLQSKDNLKTKPKETKSLQSAATLATNPTQSNIKPQAIHNLKSKLEETKSLHGAKKKIPLVARSSKILGTIKTLYKSCIGGLAYFMHHGHKVTTLFVINELVIDNCKWNPLFAQDLIREGMIVTLSDFELNEKATYSYLTSASIVTKLSDCQVVQSRKSINYDPATEKPSRTGVVLSMIVTESGRACPRFVATTIKGRTEHVFIGDDKVALNGMPVASYKHALPSDYFHVGMTVGLTKLKPCERRFDEQPGLVVPCTYEGSIECVANGTCFIDMLRASRRMSSLGKELKPGPQIPFMKSVPTKASTSVEMGSKSAASCKNARTVETESVAESGGGESSRLLITDVERETVLKTDAGRVKVAVHLIKMSDGPRTAKCEMGTQTFITGPIVTKQCFVDT